MLRVDAAGSYGEAVPDSKKRLSSSVMKRQKKALDGTKRYQKYVRQSLHGFNGNAVNSALTVKVKPEELFC